MLIMIFTQWLIIAMLTSIQKTMKTLSKIDRLAVKKQLELELAEAWCARQLHTVWKLARHIAAKNIGNLAISLSAAILAAPRAHQE